MKIKIYNKIGTPITTFFGNEVTNVSYSKTLNGIGQSTFKVRLDSEKVNNISLNHFNRIELIDEDEIVFVGYMIRFNIDYDVAEIRCVELLGILDKRITESNYIVSGTIEEALNQIIDAINEDEDTGLRVGNIVATGSVNKTYNRSSFKTVFKDITEGSNKQYRLNGDKTIDVSNQIGKDLSDSVIFQYDVKKISSSNILNFKVTDDGDAIVTEAHGKSGARTSVQENELAKIKYGLIQSYRDFRVANSQDDLDLFTSVELSNNLFSPEISLSPKVADNFRVGDTVRIIINNKLISIDDSFQVIEKDVEYKGEQKMLKIRISDLPRELADTIKEVEDRLNLLETNL